MDCIVTLPTGERSDLFRETAARLGATPAVAEKDFWVTWVLGRLFADADLSRCLLFKGGTSLSKVYGVIERFSEDIDLILDWRTVTGEDPRAPRSTSEQGRLNKAIESEAQAYIARELLPLVQATLGEHCTCAISTADPHVIDIRNMAALCSMNRMRRDRNCASGKSRRGRQPLT